MGDVRLIDANDLDGNETFDFAMPESRLTQSTDQALIARLTSTRAFKRLRQIHFLGALDFALIKQPNGSIRGSRYTRAQHSVGVARVAQRYLDLTAHGMDERLLCVAAAMLHDIGHAPFSHTLEPLFKATFGIDHHFTSQEIITGQNELGLEIQNILRSFSIEPTRVVAVLDGDDDRFHGFFSGPINFDTIEGITRCAAYLNWYKLGFTPIKVVEAATRWKTERDFSLVDSFWDLKNTVYNLIVRSPGGVLVDRLFCEIVDGSECLERSDFLSTEPALFKKIPALRTIVSSRVDDRNILSLLPSTLQYTRRQFVVDDRAPLGSRPSERRYRQTKISQTLTI